MMREYYAFDGHIFDEARAVPSPNWKPRAKGGTTD